MTAYDHKDFKLGEQQEAVLDRMKDGAWYVSYDLVGQYGRAGDVMVKIGDAGRRMRELRELGLLESQKDGRYERYRVAPKEEPRTRTVHSREEAYDLLDRGWKLVERKVEDGVFTAVLTRAS